MSFTDALSVGPTRGGLIVLGAARIIFLTAIILTTVLRSDRASAVFAFAASTFIMTTSALSIGFLRAEMGIAITVCTAILLGLSSFVVLGWRVQGILVGVTLLGFAVAAASSTGQGQVTHLFLFATACVLGSIYVARNNEETLTAVLRHANETEKSRQRLRFLNARLDRRVNARTAVLKASNRSFEDACGNLATNIRRDVERLLDAQALVENLELADTGSPADFKQRAKAAAVRMREILDALLEYVALTQCAVESSEVDLSLIAGEIVSTLKSEHPQRRVTVQIEADMTVTGDAPLLRACLKELIENSWKFSAERDEAIIHFSRIDDMGGLPAFAVRDNGDGFSAEYAGKLFHAFQRFHPNADYPGLGMGLAKASRIVARHGGRIWAQSAPDQGTTVYFTLDRPIATEST